MEFIFAVLLAVFLLLVGYWYLFSRNKKGYWEKQGIYEYKNRTMDILKVMLGIEHNDEISLRIYRQIPSEIKLIDSSFASMHFLGIRDPEIIRAVLVKDFDSFIDRQPQKFSKLGNTKVDKVQEIIYLLIVSMPPSAV